MNFIRGLTIAAIAASALSCKPETTPAESSGAASAPQTAGAPSPVVTKVVSENGMLTVDPAVIDLCTHADGVVEADVSWDATAAKTEGVQVWIQGPDGNKQLWSESGAVSTARTGRWLSNGSQVILVNGVDNTEIAKVVLESKACS